MITMNERPMTTLEMLAAKVREAEARSKSVKISAQYRDAMATLAKDFEAFRAAQDALAAIDHTIPEVCDSEEAELRRMQTQMASYGTPEERSEFLEMAIQVEAGIKDRRRSYERNLAACRTQREDAYKKVSKAVIGYRTTRQTYDRLFPGETEKLDETSVAEEMVKYLELQTPWGQFVRLRREVADIEPNWHLIPRAKVQRDIPFYTLRIWIATYRQIQEAFAQLPPEEVNEQQKFEVERFFGELVGISKKQMPGYEDAFQSNFKTDWNAYIADARAEIQRLTDIIRER